MGEFKSVIWGIGREVLYEQLLGTLKAECTAIIISELSALDVCQIHRVLNYIWSYRRHITYTKNNDSCDQFPYHLKQVKILINDTIKKKIACINLGMGPDDH